MGGVAGKDLKPPLGIIIWYYYLKPINHLKLMTPSDLLAQILSNEFEACAKMTDENTVFEKSAVNAWVAAHLPDLEDLVCDFVAERF